MENSLVKKSNKLIQASYNLKLNEQKIILALVSKIKIEDNDFKSYQMKVEDLISILGLKGSSMYSELKKTTKNLISKRIELEDEKGTLQTTWLASAYYHNTDAIVEFEFSSKLKPYLLMLKERFTSYQLKNILHLKSVYSIRIYELLKQYETIGKRTLEVIELKKILKIEDKYNRYTHFKQRILNTAYEEVNEKTDIKFEFEEIKKGRKVDKIKFMIKSNKEINKNNNVESEVAATIQENILSEEDLNIEKLKSFIKEDLSVEEYKAILNVGQNDIDKIKEKYEVAKASNYNNLMAFLISAIVGDYQMPIKNNQENNSSNRFHNFKQRTDNYSADELENMVRNKNKKI